MAKTLASSHGQSSRYSASHNRQRRRRVDPEYMYHNGGALYIPRPPSPEQIPSVLVSPLSVPSEAAMPLPDAILSVHVATNDNVGSVTEEWHQSPVIKEENDTNSALESGSDTSEKLNESEEDCQSSEDDEESEDDSSMYSSEYNNEAISEMIADEPRKSKRKHQNRNQEDSDAATRPTKRFKMGSKDIAKWDQRLEELKRFKTKHGHCRVSILSGSLYNWLRYQRHQCLNPNHSRYLKNVPERERRTKELESVFSANLRDLKSPQRTLDAVNWDGRLEELEKFKAKYGHCIVPESSGSLYNWLRNQRNVLLNPNHSKCLKDAPERERRTKELESVLGESIWDRQSKKK